MESLSMQDQQDFLLKTIEDVKMEQDKLSEGNSSILKKRGSLRSRGSMEKLRYL